MQLLFLPIYYEFDDIFEKAYGNSISPEDFFQNPALKNEILTFFQKLPKDFRNFFSLIHEFIKQKDDIKNNSIRSQPLITLLINRFLFNPTLKKMSKPDMDNNSPYIKNANYFKDLFYSNHIEEKYKNLPYFGDVSKSYIKAFDQVDYLHFFHYFHFYHYFHYL